MRFQSAAWIAGAVFSMIAIGPACAAVVTVSAFSGPWNPAIAGNPAFGTADNASPASLTVTAGDTITVTYLSGLTSAFSGAPPLVDALGYVGSPCLLYTSDAADE